MRLAEREMLRTSQAQVFRAAALEEAITYALFFSESTRMLW